MAATQLDTTKLHSAIQRAWDQLKTADDTTRIQRIDFVRDALYGLRSAHLDKSFADLQALNAQKAIDDALTKAV